MFAGADLMAPYLESTVLSRAELQIYTNVGSGAENIPEKFCRYYWEDSSELMNAENGFNSV